MKNIFTTHYQCNGLSIKTDEMGMREMQRRAYESFADQYILLKAPPASGKSRALMYVALEKLRLNQINKIIVAVPERSIAKSFDSTDLKSNGFHTNWIVDKGFDLCAPGGEQRKTLSFMKFMNSTVAKILICTHSTLRFAFDKIGPTGFNDCFIAIDEFHHVSANTDNKLGELLRSIMSETNASIMAMTGSYFRGDCVAVLSPQDEMKFTKVTYNYYEQLNGYEYLKSLGIGFHFYRGRYLDALDKILHGENKYKKTIIHIPNVNSAESTKEKLMEVDAIIDVLGTVIKTDENNIIWVKTSEGKILKIADLVNDDPFARNKVATYLRKIKNIDDIDIIIALGMAKEGFDWPYCEHTLTIGYRGSLTEIVQIIGRCTRDSHNKTHAQFTNLIAEPDAENEDVIESVNNILKAIAASLLMEEVVAPKYTFKPKDGEITLKGTKIKIKGYKDVSSTLVKDIIENDITDLKARILQAPEIQNSFTGIVDPEVTTKAHIPKIIKEIYPQLSDQESNELRDYIVASSFINNIEVTSKGSDKFISFSNKLINVADLNMDLIYSVNPFQMAFEVMSKELSPKVFKAVQQCIQAFRIKMTDDEAMILWPKINDFYRSRGRTPNIESIDPFEKRMAEALIYLRQIKNEEKDE